MQKSEQPITRFLPPLIILWVIVMLVSLKTGLFNWTTYTSAHQPIQGIDFFAVPKSFINLTEGRSAFDTFGGAAWGPYYTWYLAHPAFSVFVASWFSFFSPWTSYWAFSIVSLLLFVASAYVIAANTSNTTNRILCYFFLLCSFLTYDVLFIGNMHAPLVLSVSLIFSAMFKLCYRSSAEDLATARHMLMAGLLISFFTKPIVILFIPLLLILKETRKTTLITLLIYAIVSFLFIVVPPLNPEPIGISRIIYLFLHPAYVKEHMNIYHNNFVLTRDMKDNSIHWLNLIAQGDFYWNHVDIFSLSAFLNSLVGKELPPFVYKLPLLITLALSVAIVRIRDAKMRLETAMATMIAITFTFFLSYHSVWEYQYALVLPVLAFLPLLREQNVFYSRAIPWLLGVGALFLLPNFYAFMNRDIALTNTDLVLIRFDRVVPALIFFFSFAWFSAKAILTRGSPNLLALGLLPVRPRKIVPG